MVNILLKGRLGNNLFQIAAGASLANQHGVDFEVYSPSNSTGANISSNELMGLKQSILRNVPIRIEGAPNSEIYDEKQFEYKQIPYQSDITLLGYFQSEKYFEEQLVRQLFCIDEHTKKYIQSKYGKILKQGATSIHIRRGDYLKDIDFHPICTMNYFRKAIDKIGRNTIFLIVSNDITWCKNQFKGDNFYFAENESAVVDLYLQSMCKNNIISNSSFSWWGAWLNENPNKQVIVPYPWFGISAKKTNVSDLIPKGWIEIKNTLPLKLFLWAILRRSKRVLYHWLVRKGLL